MQLRQVLRLQRSPRNLSHNVDRAGVTRYIVVQESIGAVPQEVRQMTSTRSEFPLNLPLSGALTWDDVVDHLRVMIHGNPSNDGHSWSDLVSPETPGVRATTLHQGETPTPEEAHETWLVGVYEDALEDEFPLNLPPSGQVSLDYLLAREDEHAMVCGGVISSDGVCWTCGYDEGVWL